MPDRHHQSIPSGDLVLEEEKKFWKMFVDGHSADALAGFLGILASEPLSEGSLQGSVGALRKLERYADAEFLLALALNVHPKAKGLLKERGWLALDRAQYDDAITAFQDALRLAGNDPDTIGLLLSLLRKQERFGEAERLVQTAMLQFPASLALALEQGWVLFGERRYDDALGVFARVLRQEPKSGGALQGQIASLRLLGRLGEAKHLADRAAGLLPKSPGIVSEQGWIAFAQGQFEEAERAFRQVVDINIDMKRQDAGALVNLGWALERQGDATAFARALETCRQALEIAPERPEPYGCLGVISFRQGRIRDAESYFLKSIALDPLKGHHSDLGALYIQMGRYDDAEARLKEGLAVKNNEAGLHLQMGNLYLQTEKVKAAIGEFRQACALDPAHCEPPRALAIALLESGKTAEAELLLQTAIRTISDFERWRLHLTLSEVLSRMSEDTSNDQLLDEALKEVNVALRLAPEHPEPRFYAGIVRFKLEDYQGSARAFERCHDADKDRVDAEINARRVRALIRQQEVRSRASVVASTLVASVVIAQLIVIWFLRWFFGAGDKALVTTTMITVLVPVCLGLLVVSVVLPWLSKLKLTGLEAELSRPAPKQELASGPKGEIGFQGASRNLALPQ